MSDLKSRIMSPATTNNYEVFFGLPSKAAAETGGDLESYIKSNLRLGLPLYGEEEQLLILLSCIDTTLPGSSFATHELTNDRTGVTEKHAYRRQYDGQIDFTFMVDNNYKIIRFFELWMGYIIDQDSAFRPELKNSSYRVKFPKNYKTDTLHVTKFEKDDTNQLIYTFTEAFPLSVASTPVSYGLAEVLKVTVTMSYTKYYVSTKKKLKPFGNRASGAGTGGNAGPSDNSGAGGSGTTGTIDPNHPNPEGQRWLSNASPIERQYYYQRYGDGVSEGFFIPE